LNPVLRERLCCLDQVAALHVLCIGWNGNRGQDRDDRHHNHHLDQRETACPLRH